jgi:hypothetical protein
VHASSLYDCCSTPAVVPPHPSYLPLLSLPSAIAQLRSTKSLRSCRPPSSRLRRSPPTLGSYCCHPPTNTPYSSGTPPPLASLFPPQFLNEYSLSCRHALSSSDLALLPSCSPQRSHPPHFQIRTWDPHTQHPHPSCMPCFPQLTNTPHPFSTPPPLASLRPPQLIHPNAYSRHTQPSNSWHAHLQLTLPPPPHSVCSLCL